MSLPDGFEYRPGFLPPGEADALLQCLHREINWHRHPISLFGRTHWQPRLTAWHADPGIRYRYSGIQLEPAPWHPLLSGLRERLQVELDAVFNSVLANAYRDGADAMGWHADDEPELGPEPVIASVSVGQPRTLRIRPRTGGPSVGQLLEHGSLLIMSGCSQTKWLHAIPRSRRVMGLRINLTFRRIQVSRAA